MSVVENTQHNMTIIAYAGDNCIINSGNSVIINGQVQPNGNNYIYNYGANVGMLLGTGADTVENHGGSANINVGSGNNYVISEGDHVTIIGSDGADTVGNLGNSARINLGSGKNSVGNAGNSASIASGGGDDTVINQGSAATINTGAGNDNIYNQGANAVINSGDGNDNIDNRGTNAVINSGANNDTVGNFASNVKVNLGAGEDVFINYVVIQVDNNMNFVSTLADADKVTINGEDGGDVIENYGGEAVISGGAGGDAIYNYGISVVDANANYIGNSYTNRGYFIDGGDANDYIYNENSKATITGGAHNDTIINVGSETSLNGGTGADSINNYGNFVTISGGAGTDTISLDPAASNVRIIYNPGDGNDLIMGFNSSTTLVIGNGSDTYSSQKSGNDVIIMTGAGGDGRITLQGAASLPAVNIEGVYFDPLIIIGSDGDDNVAHWGHGVSIEADKGNDYIYFNGNNISVNGGEDKDTIVGNGNYATIEGGGDDDEIYHSGSYAKITGGKGKDLISLNSAAVNNLIRYALNDDNDLIYGFNETSTLQITNGKIDSVFSNGFDDFLIVGNQAIKLVSTAWIRKLNVVDANGNPINLGTVAISGSDEDDSIIAAASGKVIKPGAGNDYIFNQGNYITVMSGTGNKTIDLEGDNNLVNLGNGIHIVSLKGSGATVTPDDSTNDNSNTLIQGGIVYIDRTGINFEKLQNEMQQSSEETLKKVKDIIRNDPIIEDILKNKSDSEYLEGLSPEEANETVEHIRSTLDSDTVLENLRENGTAQDYRNFLTQKGEYLKRTTIGTLEHINDVSNINTLLDRFAKPPVTLKGISTGLMLDVINCAVNYSSWLGGWWDFMKKHPDAYKEAWEEIGGLHARDIIHPMELLDKVKDFNTIVRSHDRDAYDTNVLNGINSLVSTASLAISILTTVVGLAAISGTVAVGAVPLAVAGLGATVVMGLLGAYTKTEYLMKVRPGERSYADVFASQFFGYGLGGTFENASYRDAPQIIYNTSTQAEIWTGPPVNYNTVPLLKSAVPLRSVSPNNAVASYNASEATSVNVALLTGGAGNDSFSNEIENTSINASAGNDTIMNSATNVTINAGADDDLVRNTGANVKITGDSGNNSIENSGANVTITTDAGNDVVKNSEVQRVTISTGGGDDYVENFGSFTSVAAGAGADYILSFGEYNTLDAGAGSDTIHNFSNNTTVKTGDDNNLVENIADYVELTTSNGNNTINNGGYFVKIETGSGKDVIENIEGKDVSILSGGGDDYIENLGDSNSIVAGSGNDYIFSSGDSNTIIAGIGNDIIDLEGDTKTKIFYVSGDGNDVLYGFNVADTLSIGDGTGTYSSQKSGDGKDLIVTVGDGKISLIGAASLPTVNINGSEKQSFSTLTLTNADNATVTLTSGVKNADASARSKSINITGNALDNSIIGGKVADTLCGGTGNDTLTGGWKGDLFIYTAGNDVITDYNPSAGDKVSIAGNGAKYFSHITGVDTSSGNIKLTFSKNSNKTLTINNAANKKVIINSATRYFADNQLISYDKKSVTLTSDFSGMFNAGNYSNVNASAVTQAVTISGGASSGVSIVGGKKADSIVGTLGNDTLTGGYGADTFVYTGGNDVITDYAANFDRISLAGGNNAKWLSHITGVSVQNKNVTLTFGKDNSKTLTLNNAAGKKVIVNGVTRIFEDGKIHTGDKSKSTVASAAADVYWFDEHDLEQMGQLDLLMDSTSDYSLGKLDTSTNDNLTRLTKNEFILTYGDKK